MRRAAQYLLTATLVLFTWGLHAKTVEGLGAVLTSDCAGYKEAKEGSVQYQLKAGTFCGFFDFKKMVWNDPKKDSGYVLIVFFRDNSGGKELRAWVREENLEYFKFSGPRRRGGWSGFTYFESPVGGIGGVKMFWLKGFMASAGQKAKELGIEPPAVTFREASVGKPEGLSETPGGAGDEPKKQ